MDICRVKEIMNSYTKRNWYTDIFTAHFLFTVFNLRQFRKNLLKDSNKQFTCLRINIKPEMFLSA